MGDSSIEMAPADGSESKVAATRSVSIMAKRAYWDKVWDKLTEADIHQEETGRPSIHINMLKKRLKEEVDAKEVRFFQRSNLCAQVDLDSGSPESTTWSDLRLLSSSETNK